MLTLKYAVQTYPADIPYVDLVYLVLPLSELDSLTFTEGLNNTIVSSSLQLIRVITVSLEIPRGEEELVSCSHLMKCEEIQYENNAG